MRRISIIAAVCLLAAIDAVAQSQAFRLKGTVKSDAGAPVEGAEVRAEAITGFQGQPFSGQRTFAAKTNKKGEWSILGITAGTWIFDARADGLLPQVYVLPVTLSQRPTTGTFNPLLPWDVPFTLRTPTGALAPFEPIAKTASADTAQATLTAMQDGKKSADPTVLLAIADIAMLIRQPQIAQELYEQASQRQPVDPMATVGLASAGMMRVDWDAALKHFWTARDTAPKDLRPALGAAVTDLQKISRIK